MTKVSKAEFEETLGKVLQEIKFDRHKVESVKEEMFKHGVMRGKVQRIINGTVGLDKLDNEVFCLLTIAVHHVTQLMIINPYGFFSKEEIEKAKSRIKSKDVEVVEYPIVFKNVMQSNDNDYVLLENVKTLIKLYNANLLNYNYEVTKNYKFEKNVVGKMVKTIDINMREVKTIAKDIMANKAIVGPIVVNILRDSSNIAYSPQHRTLTVSNGKIDIINGIHYLNALAYVVERQNDFNMKVELEIKNYNLNEIKRLYNILKLQGSVN
jgi:hypothetical protein